MKKSIVLFVVNIKNIKTLKYHTFYKKTLVFSNICSKCSRKDEKIFKEEESNEILKILDLSNNIEKYQKTWQKNTYVKNLD